MIEFYIAIDIAVVLSILFIYFCTLDKPVLHTSLKGLASLSVISLCLVTISITGFGLNAIILCIGLLFCALGDVLLALLEFKQPEYTDKIRISGTSAFAMAQIAFIVLLALVSNCLSLFGLIIGIIFAIGLIFLRKPMGLDFGKLLVPSLIYGCLLATNVGGSIINMIANFSVSNVLLCLGFVLFIISDLILSKIYYGGDTKNLSKRLNYITYYAAIIVLASSFIIL